MSSVMSPFCRFGKHNLFAESILLAKLIRAMAGAGPMAIRAAARRLSRDVKAVHGDVHALLNAGVIQRTADGRILFPFDAIHVDVMLRAA
jgi:predicted transcriptional regulator